MEMPTSWRNPQCIEIIIFKLLCFPRTTTKKTTKIIKIIKINNISSIRFINRLFKISTENLLNQDIVLANQTAVQTHSYLLLSITTWKAEVSEKLTSGSTNRRHHWLHNTWFYSWHCHQPTVYNPRFSSLKKRQVMDCT